MENLLELDGEDCLKKPQLINDHPIVYWNLVTKLDFLVFLITV